MNYKQIKAIETANKKRWLKVNNELNEASGIYILTRVDEVGIKHGYIGQAKHILTRLAQHLMGYQHIDLSLKKHGLYSADNKCGWKVDFKEYREETLDDMERVFIKTYANYGYQLKNKTIGGQNEGKIGLNEQRQPKTYREGVEFGYKKALKEVAVYFEKYLDVVVKQPSNKIKERKLNEFIRDIRTQDKNL